MIRNINTGQPIGGDFRSAAEKLRVFTTEQLPEFTEMAAQDIVDKSFQGEHYEGNTSKWKGRKKEEQPGKERGGRRALLVKTGALVEQTKAERRGMDVVIASNTPYSQVHNEGLRAGRGAGFQMPQRQYMPIPGETNHELEAQIDRFVEDHLDKIFG
jgi:phage gpG-like protein